MSTEQTTPEGHEERYPGPHPVYEFEVWLAAQTDRQDETGAIARFVIADLEKGCWPTTNSIDSGYAWWGNEKAQERQLRAFKTHIVYPHHQPARVMFALERAFKEFVVAEAEATKQEIAWMDERDLLWVIL